jgi:DNA-binding PadR family transcriptional regulator
MRKLTSAPKILNLLFEERWLNKYQIAQKTGLSYSRVHESIKLLEERGLIEGRPVGKSRAGLEKREYSLTPAGIKEVLGIAKNLAARAYAFDLDSVSDIVTPKISISEKSLGTLLRNYEDFLPELIVKKWNFFKQEKILKKYILKTLSLHIGDRSNTFLSDLLFVSIVWPKKFFKLVEALSKDPDLRLIASEAVGEMLKECRGREKAYIRALEYLRAPRLRGESGKERGGERA